MLYLLLQGLWFLTPAMWSNMAPVWAAKIAWLEPLAVPIDFNKTFRDKSIFGKNKTFRGFFAGIVLANLAAFVQWVLSSNFVVLNNLEFFPMDLPEYLALGTLIGFGALVGDAVESFAKRQIGIKPGEPWFPFDQSDYIIGAFVFSLPLTALTFEQYAATAIVGFLLHPAATFIGWRLGLKDKPI